jgi:hypothetical protein
MRSAIKSCVEGEKCSSLPAILLIRSHRLRTSHRIRNLQHPKFLPIQQKQLALLAKAEIREATGNQHFT